MLSLCLIEDNQKLWSMLQESLIEEWYSCDRYQSVESFPVQHSSRYHVFLLDINLPGADGVSLANTLRESWSVGIIFLTANGTLDDKMKWFNAWADDYIVKPFATSELIARIESLAIRLSDKHYFIHNNIYIDRKHREAKKWDEQIHLTPIEREVLWCLLKNSWYQCNRWDIIEHVRWYDALFSMSRSLDVTIAHLRKKLDKEMIETVSGIWYKLITTV